MRPAHPFRRSRPPWRGLGGLRALVAALLAALVLAVVFGPGTARAQAASATEAAAFLDTARAALDRLQRADLERLSDDRLQTMRRETLALQSGADAMAARLEPQLAALQARLTELGTPADGVAEARDVADQRKELEREVAALDAQLKLARLVSLEAGQTATTLWTQRRALFQARLGERTHALPTPRFWAEVGEDLPGDRQRVLALLRATGDAFARVRPGTWGVLALVVLLVLGAGRAASIWLTGLTTRRVRPGRLRRSLHAVGRVLLGGIVPGLLALAIDAAIGWQTTLTEPVQRLLAAAGNAAWFGGCVAALGGALLSVGRPSWRLAPIGDALARRLRWLPGVLAVLIVAGVLSGTVASTANVSLASTVALKSLQSLAMGLALTAALLVAHRARRRATADADKPERWGPWLSLLFTAAWLVLPGSLLLLAIGYVALGTFVINQVVWGAIVLCAAWLLAVLVDDAFTAVLVGQPPPAEAAAGAPASPQARERAAVLLSALGRIVIGLLALLLLMAPFGEGPSELFRRGAQWQYALTVGEVVIRPGMLLQALGVLLAALAGVRLVKGWLTRRYLPTTALDPGMQLSAATLFGYAGVVAAISLALSAVGIGLERIAWVASALSVGIGFGLQAVVQNFVSGLILLTERPVKVGDWVSLSGVEGDIRRINVRATEIQLGDRSTVIMPNSEFITKTVRNVTHANPLGLVKISLPLPLSTDARQARTLMLASLTEHPRILETPSPNVQLDGIDAANLLFNVTGFVDSPRLAYGVRSELLFDILQRLADAGITLARTTTLVMAPQEGLPQAPASAPASLLPPTSAAVPPAGPA